MKKELRELDSKELENILIKLNEKTFRKKQINDWIWKKGITDFDQMNNIPKTILDYLKNEFCIYPLVINKIAVSKDKTVKLLFETHDKNFFEGVLIPSKDRVTACLSSQIGCGFNCSFCQSGKNGLSRNLQTGELLDQFFLMNKISHEHYNNKISNIVFMGVGEPLENLDNIEKFVNKLTSEKYLNFSPSRITLSTAGMPQKIKNLAVRLPKINLAISLHSAINKRRSLIMPINKKYNLDMISEAIKYYHGKTGNRITYEYLLLKDINDSVSDAISLSEFTKISPCKINLIEYNEISDSSFKKTTKQRLEKFYEVLKNKNLIVNIRQSKGADISAACGQLVKNIDNF